MYEPWGYEEDHIASPQEAVNEWADWVGIEHRDRQWLLHDRDIWVKNPHYTGPDQRHPEDDSNQWEDTHFADGTPTAVYDDGNWKRRR